MDDVGDGENVSGVVVDVVVLGRVARRGLARLSSVLIVEAGDGVWRRDRGTDCRDGDVKVVVVTCVGEKKLQPLVLARRTFTDLLLQPQRPVPP